MSYRYWRGFLIPEEDCGCTHHHICNDPCHTGNSESDYLIYKGAALVCTGIANGDTLTVTLQKIEEQICQLKNTLTTTTSTSNTSTTTSTTTTTTSIIPTTTTTSTTVVPTTTSTTTIVATTTSTTTLVSITTTTTTTEIIIYYIANAGSDVADGGSPETAWQTIDKVNNSTFSAGNQILFNKDDIWREQLTVPSSGSSGNPIIFGAYGTGENPIITGANLYSGFSNGGSNIWDATVTTQPLVVLKSKALQTNVGSRAAITSDGKWYWTGNTLSVYATSDPSGLVEAGYRTRAMDTGSKNYLTFNDIVFECINARGYPLIYTSHSTESEVKFYNCTMQYSAGTGIVLGGNADGDMSGGVLDNCIIRYNWENGVFVSYDATSYTINNCQVYSNGLDTTSGSNGIWGHLGNYIITNCDIYDNGRFMGSMPPHGIYQYTSTGTVTIENCTIHDQIYGSAIRLRGSATVTNCALYNNGLAGVSMGENLSAGETYTLIGNLIYGNSTDAIVGNGALTGIINITMYNNTIYHNGTWELLQVAVSINNLTLKNNIFYSTANRIINVFTAPTTAVIDNNIYYRSDGHNSAGDLWRVDSSYPTTLSAWQALGNDVHGYLTDPLLVNTTTDFSLQSGSPAINAGVNVGLTHDILGNPIVGTPDIGAYESTIPNSITTSTTTLAPTTTTTTTIVSTPFITTWNTENAGSATKTIVIPTTGTAGTTYNCNVDWGDGNVENFTGTDGTAPTISHIYATTGVKTISISGTFPRICFNNGGDKLKILTVEQWGTGVWNSMYRAFYGCTNLTGNYTDIPDTHLVTDMTYMFYSCANFNSPVAFNTTLVTDMSGMFYDCMVFNQLVSGFNTDNVTNIYQLFQNCTAFNQSVSSWNTSKVTNMQSVFQNCTSFKQSLASWNIAAATSMDYICHACDINATGTTTNYDNTLISWAAQTVYSGMTNVRFTNCKYSAGTAETARGVLTGTPNSWTITDGGM